MEDIPVRFGQQDAVVLFSHPMHGFQTEAVMFFGFSGNKIAVIFIVQAVKELLKRRKVKAGTNKTIVAVISFVAAFVLMGATNAFTIYAVKTDMFFNQFVELPFTIGDLTGIDDSGYLKSKMTMTPFFSDS